MDLYISKTFLQKQAWPPNMAPQTFGIYLHWNPPSRCSNFIIGSVFKHPPMKPYSFNTSFSQLLQKIKIKNKKTIITGNFNLNLLSYAENIGTFEFLESVFPNNFTPQINLPTRITGTSSTLIDNILINSQENVYTFLGFSHLFLLMCHLKRFSMIVNCGRWSNMEVVRFPTLLQPYYFHILRCQLNIHVLQTVYHSLFGTHLLYAC